MQLDKIAAYWDLRADGYSDSVHRELNSENSNTFKDYLHKAMPQGKAIKCLDMGCGPGFFTLLLLSDGHDVISADYSEEMLERTRRNCMEAGYEATTVRADAQALPFADSCFDFVCSRNLVWNLEDPIKAYSEWFRVLKHGGRMFIFDGNHYLHYYNEDYMKAKAFAQSSKPMNSHDTAGVDPTPINTIAKDLPLSSVQRPDWDADILPKIGFTDIHIETLTQTYKDQDSGLERSIIHSFAISCAKP